MTGQLVQLRGRKQPKPMDTTARLVATLAVAGLLSGIAIVIATFVTLADMTL